MASTGNRFAAITPDDHAGSIWIAAILCFVYSAITVMTRGYLRLKMYELDDYLILAATAAHLGQMVAIIIGLEHGLGQTVSLLSSDNVATASKAVYAAQILFIAGACLAKCSTLYLMMRLFNLNGPKSTNHGKPKLYHWLCMAILGIMVIWSIGSIIGLSVDCSSENMIRAADRAQCPNQQLRWWIIGGLDVATEVILITVAVVIVLPVQLSSYLKFQVVLAFLFRLPLIALAILRAFYVGRYTHAANPGLAQVSIIVIQQVYLCWSIIAATIPNLKAFVRSFGSGFGIGIDMETYTNAYGSKGSHRNRYELGSVKNNTVGSRYARSQQQRSFHGNEVEDSANRLHQRTTTTHAQHDPHHDQTSIGSAGSQDHIIRKDVRWNVQYEDNHAL